MAIEIDRCYFRRPRNDDDRDSVSYDTSEEHHPDRQLQSYINTVLSIEEGTELINAQQVRIDYIQRDNPSTYVVGIEYLLTWKK
jgi:hypothetical protein